MGNIHCISRIDFFSEVANINIRVSSRAVLIMGVVHIIIRINIGSINFREMKVASFITHESNPLYGISATLAYSKYTLCISLTHK